MLSRLEALERKQRPEEIVPDVPEWGDVLVVGMSVGERGDFLTDAYAEPKADAAERKRQRRLFEARLVQQCVRDAETRQLVFEPCDVSDLAELPAAIIVPVARVAYRLSAIGEEEAETTAAAKN